MNNPHQCRNCHANARECRSVVLASRQETLTDDVRRDQSQASVGETITVRHQNEGGGRKRQSKSVASTHRALGCTRYICNRTSCNGNALISVSSTLSMTNPPWGRRDQSPRQTSLWKDNIRSVHLNSIKG